MFIFNYTSASILLDSQAKKKIIVAARCDTLCDTCLIDVGL